MSMEDSLRKILIALKCSDEELIHLGVEKNQLYVWETIIQLISLTDMLVKDRIGLGKIADCSPVWWKIAESIDLSSYSNEGLIELAESADNPWIWQQVAQEVDWSALPDEKQMAVAEKANNSYVMETLLTSDELTADQLIHIASLMKGRNYLSWETIKAIHWEKFSFYQLLDFGRRLHLQEVWDMILKQIEWQTLSPKQALEVWSEITWSNLKDDVIRSRVLPVEILITIGESEKDHDIWRAIAEVIDWGTLPIDEVLSYGRRVSHESVWVSISCGVDLSNWPLDHLVALAQEVNKSWFWIEINKYINWNELSNGLKLEIATSANDRNIWQAMINSSYLTGSLVLSILKKTDHPEVLDLLVKKCDKKYEVA